MTQFSMDNAADMVLGKPECKGKLCQQGRGNRPRVTGEELADLAFGDIFALPPKVPGDEIWQALTRAGTLTREHS